MGSAQAAWNRLPYAETRPVGIAQKSIPGTKLVSSTGLGNAQALIGSDISETVTLGAGKSTAVIQLRSQQNIHTITFNNDAAAGKVTVAGSADNKSWSALGSAEFSAADLVVQAHFATATAKYARLTFESEKGGNIRSFQIYGDSTDDDYNLVPKDAADGGATVNLSSGVGGARPIYAFPTPTNVGELGYLHNVFKFPKSRDKYRTIVYDLGATRTVKHFATSYSQRPVRIEVFAFEELPEKKDWRGKLTLDPAIFNTLKPVAVGEDPKGVGHIKITPAKAVTARYISLRFEPNYQRGAAVGLFDVGTEDVVAAATTPPAEPVQDQFGALPGFRFTAGQAGDEDAFTIGAVEFASAGTFQTKPVGSGGDSEEESNDDQKKKKNGDETNENNNYTSNAPPYISGAPGSPPATLPVTTDGNTTSNNNNNGSKGHHKGGGNSGNGGGNLPPSSP